MHPQSVDNSFEKFFSGEELWGDNFNSDQIEEWYKQEKDAYEDLLRSYDYEYKYIYHAHNYQFGYKYLDFASINNALGFGASTGDEFFPIADRLNNITILEPGLSNPSPIGNIFPKIVEPNPSGIIPFENESFDLITCFGVLHHCPNVSFILEELIRVLRKGGFLLVRESIRSMGDWRKPRQLCTPNERGIPPHIFDKVFEEKSCRSAFDFG